MDPISAFGLAVNILTVIDLSAKVISNVSEIRSYGETIRTNDRAIAAQHLESRCQKLIESSDKASKSSHDMNISALSNEDDVTLQQLAKEAKDIAQDIQHNLIRRQKRRAMMVTLRDSVLIAWGERKMKEKTDRLDAIRDEIQFGLIVSIKSSIDAATLSIDDALRRFDNATRETIQGLLSENDAAQSRAEGRARKLNQTVGRHFGEAERKASERHGEVLGAIQKTGGPITSLETEDPSIITKYILRQLWFPSINNRYEDIKPAHHETFKWIFSRDVQLQNSCTFLDWIDNGTGMYWMSGRAGSGKSTLLKYMADDPRTTTLLQAWAAGEPLIIAKYWFWDQSSDVLQKSLYGLFRSILHGVVQDEKAFAPLLFPAQFEQNPGDWMPTFPTINDLKRAFQRLVSLESPPRHIALLIDGLDEFSASREDQRDLAESLKLAAHSRHMKVIASSRPETVFEKAFENCEKLYLHEMTSRDRTIYVADKLYEHQRTSYLVRLPGGMNAMDHLITSAVHNSEGIFVWLRLVVESLVQELDVCACIADLQSVLAKFPRGLEMLFLHIIRRMLRDGERRGVECLRIMQRSLNLQFKQSPHRFHSQRGHIFSLTALCLDGAFTNLGTILNQDIRPLESSEFEDAMQKVGNQLRNWCAGLLELKYRSPNSPSVRSIPRLEWEDPKVVFIHKTVAEFLTLPSTQSELADDLAATSFDMDISLMKGILRKMKTEALELGFATASRIWYSVEIMMRLAGLADTEHLLVVSALLRELDRSMNLLTQILRRSLPLQWREETNHLFATDHWTCYFPWAMRSNAKFNSGGIAKFPAFSDGNIGPVERSAGLLSIAVECGLAAFVQDMLNDTENQGLVKITAGVPLLSSACRPPPFSILIPGAIRPTIIQRLIELGAEPNQIYKNTWGDLTTPWKDMLRTLNDLRIVNVRGARQLAEVLMTMIEGGADRDARIGTKALGRMILHDNAFKHFDSSLPTKRMESIRPLIGNSSLRERNEHFRTEQPAQGRRILRKANPSKSGAGQELSKQDYFEDSVGSGGRYDEEFTVRELIHRAFIAFPDFRYISDDDDVVLPGDYVPFEDISRDWEINNWAWGNQYGAVHPPGSLYPRIASADRNLIKQIGLDLLQLLDEGMEGFEGAKGAGVVQTSPQASGNIPEKKLEGGLGSQVAPITDKRQVPKLSKIRRMKTKLLQVCLGIQK